MLEILMYLFEHYIVNQSASKIVSENDITEELKQAGFYPEEITRALQWLDDLESLKSFEKITKTTTPSLRVYNPEERVKLNAECRGFLLFLEQSGILDSTSREMVIDRALALDEPLNLGKLKWVTLVVLFNRTGKEAELEWLENKVLNGADNMVH